MTLRGLVIYNGFLTSDKFFDFASMLAQAGRERGHSVGVAPNDKFLNDFSGSIFSKTAKQSYDYVLFTDKDIYLAKMFERSGIPVFNSAEAIALSDDKIKTYDRLVELGLPIPETIVAPKTFGLSIERNRGFIEAIVDYFGYPFIMKEAFGSFGEQVYLVTSEKELFFYLEKIAGAPFVFQEYIASSYGVDLRLQVVGDEVVAAMKRRSEGDFRANVSAGGMMEPYEPTKAECDLAVKATKAMGADFAGVDLLLGENGRRYICEVNSNAHIRNLFDCTGINVAPFILAYIESVLRV